MSDRRRRHRSLGGGAILLTLIAATLGPGASTASAVAPTVEASWSSDVFSSTARLHATINPNSLSTTYRFEYLTKAAYDANPVGSKFNGAIRTAPPFRDITGATPVNVLQPLSNLGAGTVYRYRAVATNSSGTTFYPAPPDGFQFFVTFPQAVSAFDPCANAGFRLEQNVKNLLPDCRAYEMVSPVDKNGGQIDPPGTLADGGVIQASAGGGAVTYSSAASFAGGSTGASSASQYIGTRTGTGWLAANITASLFSGSYDTETDGVPYRLFSADLGRGLLLSGKHCRGDATGCPVANPPLGGTDAPAGYQNYYSRETSNGAFQALLGSGDVASLATDPADFALSLAGVSADLQHVVLSSCSALAGASDGCPADANLYKHSAGSLSLINPTPGAALAAQSGAVSADGQRVYWVDTTSGNLMVRNGAQTRQLDAGAGGGGSFQTASADGSIAYFTDASDDLWRYNAGSDTATRLTSSGDVVGVLGAASNGSNLYYLRATGLFRCSNASSAGANGCDGATRIAEDADASNHPPASGTARVSADGTKLLFVATTPLTRADGSRYDNTDLFTRAPDSQVYLYDASGGLTCVSCNPSNARPVGASSIPGALQNGSSAEATTAYKPRALSANGQRVYFESADTLVLSDINNAKDVYQWQAQGSGSCSRAGGCVELISSGLSAGGAGFIDASADGSDAYFLTDRSLVRADPGSVDLYDARIGGGYPVPIKPIPCTGDSCQVLPSEPVDPTLTTLLPGPGNRPVRWRRYGVRSKQCPKGKVAKTVTKRNGKKVKKCVKKKKRKRTSNRSQRRARR